MVGVSGGIDSCTLVHALVAAGSRPVVTHYDHGWGPAAAEDPAFVGELAARLGLQFRSGAAHPAPARQREDEARRQRYAFFAQQAVELGCEDLVLAHHADDQVETLLLQMLRGGGSGAVGMRETSTMRVTTDGREVVLRVHRPWLGVWRREIEAYAQLQRIDWKEDATNLDGAHLRNRLRHDLVPLLEAIGGPHVRGKLLDFAATRRDEQEWLDAICKPWAMCEKLSVKDLRAQPEFALRRIIWAWLLARGVAGLRRRHVEEVAAMVAVGGPAKVNLPGDKHVRRRMRELFVENGPEKAASDK